MDAANLYIHFPFCRRKCAYCALPSRAGVSEADRAEYVRRLVAGLAPLATSGTKLATVYFGGGTPAQCDLRPILAALAPHLAPDAEFTVELHPLDVTRALLETLRAGGVNRLSMGVQALDDATLSDMGRGYGVADAARAFARIRDVFDNAGIDLILGYPRTDGRVLTPQEAAAPIAALAAWGLRHASVYALIREPDTLLDRRLRVGRCAVPSDDAVLDQLKAVSEALGALGLKRYEISNWAQPGFECRHNLAVWRGEDYIGLGTGAAGRRGRKRTLDAMTCGDDAPGETVDADYDLRERTLFRLRARDGLDTRRFPAWRETLDRHVREGALVRAGDVYRLTARGTEICDAILAELV